MRLRHIERETTLFPRMAGIVSYRSFHRDHLPLAIRREAQRGMWMDGFFFLIS